MNVLGVIPARYGSTRFLGKPLAIIDNKPMIQHVYERAKASRKIDKLIIATDDNRIYDLVKNFDAESVLTSKDIRTGTDRVYFASMSLDFDVILNIQGDEPLIDPNLLDLIVKEFENDDDLDVVTPIKKVKNSDELENPNMVRVVIDKNGFALYFSRAVIPYNRENDIKKWLKNNIYYRHIGIYGYKKEFLKKFVEMGESYLERIEKLEQLRILENGYKIKTVLTDYNPVCVDLPEDIKKVENIIKN